MIRVEAHQHLVGQAEQAVLEGGVGAVADLLLVVADFQVVAARHAPRGGAVGVGLAVAPVALALQPVELVAHGDGAVGRPLGVEPGPLVAVLDFRIVDVVVLAQRLAAQAAVDQRHAEVALRRLPALVVRQRELQLRRHVEPHGRAHGQALGLPALHEAVGLAVADVEAVGELVVDRPAAAKGHLAGGVGAHRDQRLVLDRAARRLLGHHVDGAADGTLAVHHRGRAAQHLDAVDRPGVEREGDGTRACVEARAVEELHHRAVARETARHHRGAAIAGAGRAGDASGAGGGIDHRDVAACADGVARQHFDAGRRFQRREAEAAAGVRGFVDGERGMPFGLDLHRLEGLARIRHFTRRLREDRGRPENQPQTQ